MKTLIATLLLVAALAAQTTSNISQTAYGYITAANTDCTVPTACVWIVAPANVASASIQISGTFSATLRFESSVGGTTWVSASTTGGVSSATSAGVFAFSLNGAQFLRVRASAYSSGPARVDISVNVGTTGIGDATSLGGVPVCSPFAPTDGQALTYDGTNKCLKPAAGGASPSSIAPAMDGVAAAGSSAAYAREDHIHPTDTSRQASVDRFWTAGVNGNIPSSSLNLPPANAPVLNPIIGTNVVSGVWSFAAASAQSLYGQLPIPAVVPASLVLEITWRGTDTTIAHSVVWNWNYGCSSTTIDPALASAGTATTAAVNVSNQTQVSTITLSSPSCSAGDQMFFQLVRRGDTDSVTTAVDVALVRIHS